MHHLSKFINGEEDQQSKLSARCLASGCISGIFCRNAQNGSDLISRMTTSSEWLLPSDSDGAIALRTHTDVYRYIPTPSASLPILSLLFHTLTLILLYPAVHTLSLNTHSFLRTSVALGA